MVPVSFQLFLHQGKGPFTHHRRNGQANPLRSRTLVICIAAFRHVFPLTQQPRGRSISLGSDSGALREEFLPACLSILWILTYRLLSYRVRLACPTRVRAFNNEPRGNFGQNCACIKGPFRVVSLQKSCVRV
jgi:hypothetical protein